MNFAPGWFMSGMEIFIISGCIEVSSLCMTAGIGCIMFMKPSKLNRSRGEGEITGAVYALPSIDNRSRSCVGIATNLLEFVIRKIPNSMKRKPLPRLSNSS